MKYSNFLMISMLCLFSCEVYGSYTEYVNENNKNNCSECIDLVNSIIFEEKKLNSSIVVIIDIIKTICNHAFGPSARLCSFVIENIDNIVKMIGEGMDAEKICQYLKMCQSYLYM